MVQDILKFASKYNAKYKEKLNIHIIIQGDNEEINLINKLSNYLLDLLLGIESKETNNEQKNLENILKITLKVMIKKIIYLMKNLR